MMRLALRESVKETLVTQNCLKLLKGLSYISNVKAAKRVTMNWKEREKILILSRERRQQPKNGKIEKVYQ